MIDLPPSPASESPAAEDGRWVFESRRDLTDAWHRALARVAEVGSRELFICDRDHALWPLGERATLEHLTAWAMSHRRLTVLAAQFDTLQRQHPRWVLWRRQWSHVVQCRQAAEADVPEIPTMVLAPGVLSLRVRDPQRYRGRYSSERADLVRDRDDLDAFLQRSSEAFPVTSLGL